MVAMESAAIRSVLRAFIFPNELQNAIAFESRGKYSLYHGVADSERTIMNGSCAKLVGAKFFALPVLSDT